MVHGGLRILHAYMNYSSVRGITIIFFASLAYTYWAIIMAHGDLRILHAFIIYSSVRGMSMAFFASSPTYATMLG